MKRFEIAAIPGDGAGKEVVAAAEKVLHTAAEVHGGLYSHLRHFHGAVTITWNTAK